MTTDELILKQIQILRGAYAEYKTDAAEFADRQNDFERDEALAGTRIIAGYYYDEETGEQVKLTNDIARKAYIKDNTLNASVERNKAKETRDASAKKIDVEISVLSALKHIAANEQIEDAILAKYDLTPGADGI